MANSGLNISGIYKIESKVHPDRCYIGSAVNLRNRRNGHFFSLKNGTHKNPKLQAHFCKYGECDLSFSVLAKCNKNELLPENGVIWLEQFFIDAYKPWFNICKIAGSPLGRRYSDEIRARCKKRGMSRSVIEAARRANIGRIPWNKGLTKETNDVIAKMAEAHGDKIRGRPSKKRGMKLSEEARRTMSVAQTGRKDSEETRRRKSEAAKKRPPRTDEHKRNLSIANKGKKKIITEDCRVKISNSLKQWWRDRKEEEILKCEK